MRLPLSSGKASLMNFSANTVRFPRLALLTLFMTACAGASSSPPTDDPPEAESLPTDPVATDSNPGNPSSSKDAGVPQAPAGCTAASPREHAVSVFALPDATTTPFVETLERATKSIRVMVYQMGYGPILDSLVAKAKAGVEVRVILDVKQVKTNQKYFDALTAAGAQVKWSSPEFVYMHAKVIVVDEKELLLSTSNYSASYMAKERNYAARDTDPLDVKSIVDVFDADWAGTKPDLSCTRMVISPVNARSDILDLIKSAKTSLEIESMQFADRDVSEAVIARKANGVSVSIILATPTWIDANAEAATTLKAAGIQARYLEAPSVHVKAIVVDGKRAYLGSENLSYTSLSKNREVGLIVDEQENIALMQSTFAADFAIAKTF